MNTICKVTVLGLILGLSLGANVPARAGTSAYVANGDFTANSVSVIDTGTNSVVATVPTGFRGPLGVAITPDGAFAYVTNNGFAHVKVIDTATNAVVATVNWVGGGPWGVATWS